jgi:hypothetical protein
LCGPGGCNLVRQVGRYSSVSTPSQSAAQQVPVVAWPIMWLGLAAVVGDSRTSVVPAPLTELQAS